MNRTIFTAAAVISGFLTPIIPAAITGHLSDPAVWSAALAAALGAGKLYLTTPADKATISTSAAYPAATTPKEALTSMPSLTESLSIAVTGLPATVAALLQKPISNLNFELPSVPLQSWEAEIASAFVPSTGVTAEVEVTLTVANGAFVITAAETENLPALPESLKQPITIASPAANVVAPFLSGGFSATATYTAQIAA